MEWGRVGWTVLDCTMKLHYSAALLDKTWSGIVQTSWDSVPRGRGVGPPARGLWEAVASASKRGA